MPDITGRDGYLIAEALALAIETMRPWPKSYRPESNIADMQKLLVAKGSGQTMRRFTSSGSGRSSRRR